MYFSEIIILSSKIGVWLQKKFTTPYKYFPGQYVLNWGFMYTHGANERGSVQTGLMQKNRLFEYLKTKMYDNKFLIFYHFLEVSLL